MRDRFDRVLRNVRYATRTLARSPSFTLTAVASLSLGIAVNTVMFSVVSSLLMRPLGAGDDDLVRIGRTARGERTFKSADYEEYVYLREHASSLADIVGHDIAPAAMRTADGSRPISVELVAGDYFATLGVSPSVGRAFRPDVDRVREEVPVAIISDRFRRRVLATDAPTAIVGRVLQLYDHAFTIVGVAPPDFTGTFPGVDVDVWIPADMAWVTRPLGERATAPRLFLVGRLAEGVSMRAAEAELDLLAAQMAGTDAERGARRTFVIERARGAMPLFAGVLRVFLSMLMAVVAIVLLIACANVAGLQLARARARRGEVAVRLAVGASRAQLVAQLFVESLVLALLGGAGGLLLSIWPLEMLNGLSLIPGPTGTPIFLDLRLEGRVLLFTLAATMLAAIAFGLVPALQATRLSLTSALKDSRGQAGSSRFRLGRALVVAQVCVSFVLMTGATLLFRSLRNTEHIDVGFDPDQMVVAAVDLARLPYDRPTRDRFFEELLGRTREFPGMERAALADFVPFSGSASHPVPLRVPGVTPPAGQQHLTVRTAHVSDRYFATMRHPLLRGREFEHADRMTQRGVAIVNEALARRYWPDGDALGKRIGIGEALAEFEIVGVAASARFSSFGGAVEPLVFLPAFNAGQLLVRTSAPTADVLRSVRQVVAEIDPSAVPFVSGRSLRETMTSSMSLVPVKIARVVFGVAGVIALLLAAGGLYGLVSYTTEQRMREIGIRVAMGANRANVFHAIVGGAFRLTGIGLVVGIVGAVGVMHALSSFLYGLTPTDTATFAAIATLLAVVALGASYAAARRALNVDPMLVLRYE